MDIVVLYLIVNRNFLLETARLYFLEDCVLHFDMYFLMYLILESQNNDYRYNMAVI